MMQHTTVVSSSRMAYMILREGGRGVIQNPFNQFQPFTFFGKTRKKTILDLDAMLLLQELGQHWQMAQAAEPKQQAAVLPSEMMAPMLQLETGAL